MVRVRVAVLVMVVVWELVVSARARSGNRAVDARSEKRILSEDEVLFAEVAR